LQIEIKKNKTKNVNSKAISALLGVFGVLIISAAAVGVLLGIRLKSDTYDSLFNVPKINIIDTRPAVTDNPAVTQTPYVKTISYNGKTYIKNEGIVNLLFLGIDSNAERREKNKGYRSDMVMVCAVDTVAQTATLLSIPRDTYTTMYKVDRSGAVEGTVQAKINAAYAYAGNEYRAANSMACVQMFLQRECELAEPLGFTLDIPVSLYASIDMDGISKVASAVGGVEVTLDATIPDVGRKGKTVLLKGSNAEEYIRNRHDTAGGDITRASRQRTFMLSLAKKIKNMGGVDIILSLYDELQRYVKTNLNTDHMLDFAKLLKKIKIDDIKQVSVSGKSKRINGSSVIVHDEKETLELLLDIYYIQVQ